jgi:hypothetical protein
VYSFIFSECVWGDSERERGRERERERERASFRLGLRLCTFLGSP